MVAVLIFLLALIPCGSAWSEYRVVPEQGPSKVLASLAELHSYFGQAFTKQTGRWQVYQGGYSYTVDKIGKVVVSGVQHVLATDYLKELQILGHNELHRDKQSLGFPRGDLPIPPGSVSGTIRVAGHPKNKVPAMVGHFGYSVAFYSPKFETITLVLGHQAPKQNELHLIFKGLYWITKIMGQGDDQVGLQLHVSQEKGRWGPYGSFTLSTGKVGHSTGLAPHGHVELSVEKLRPWYPVTYKIGGFVDHDDFTAGRVDFDVSGKATLFMAHE